MNIISEEIKEAPDGVPSEPNEPAADLSAHAFETSTSSKPTESLESPDPSIKQFVYISLTIALLVFSLIGSSRPADIVKLKLPAIYSDGMVLQRGKQNTIHGIATPGVDVTLRVANQSVTTRAGLDGKWNAQIPSLNAGGPYTIQIDGADHIDIKNVLCGDVWLCSGQSNMAREMSLSTHEPGDIKNANDPYLRFFTVPEQKSDRLLVHGSGLWQQTNPSTVENFSACAYYFARELRSKTSVPIGIISCCARGLPLNVWCSGEVPGIEKADGPFITASVFNAMMAPLIGYGVKGIVWYQGESDIFRAAHYKKILPRMLRDLRSKWSDPQMPVLLVQLPNYASHDKQPGESLWAEFREVQIDAAREIDNSHVIVTVDSAKESSVGLHPLDKRLIAARLAKRALQIPGTRENSNQDENPRYESCRSEEQFMIVHLHTKNPLQQIKGINTSGLTIAGADKHFFWANARVEPNGTDIRVWSPRVTRAAAVRYAWADNPDARLYNAAGDPVVPFRTDNFKAKPEDYQVSDGRFNFLKDMAPVKPH